MNPKYNGRRDTSNPMYSGKWLRDNPIFIVIHE